MDLQQSGLRTLAQATDLALHNLIHGIADSAHGNEGSIEGATGDGSVTIQMAHHSWIVRQACTQVLQ